MSHTETNKREEERGEIAERAEGDLQKEGEEKKASRERAEEEEGTLKDIRDHIGR